MASIGSNHKRKRKPEHDTKMQYKHKNHSSSNNSSKQQASKSLTSSSNYRPTWVPTTDTYPWNISSAIYGNCANVSSRYEKIGRIGEGTYGKFIICNARHVHNFTLSYITTYSTAFLHYMQALYTKQKINKQMK